MKKETFGVLGCAVLMAAIAVNAGSEWSGYGGPQGQRVYRDANPPVKFDMTTGEGVRWQTVLPSWGHSSPLYVNGRIFLSCEPGPSSPFPSLVCLDAATGRILWGRELNPLPAIYPDDAEKQEQLRKDIKAFQDRLAELRAEVVAEVGGGDRARRARDVIGGNRELNNERGRLEKEAGMRIDTYRWNQYAVTWDCYGDAFATPVTDGEHVYATTAWGYHGCFDFDGNIKWVQHVRGAKPQFNTIGRSPLLYKNMLIDNTDRTLRALDKNTGAILWTGEDKGGYAMVSPAVITVDGQDVLLTAGISVYLLPDGKPLNIEGWKDEGMQILVKYDEPDVAFFCGSGEHCGWTNKGNKDPYPPAAVRFSLSGDSLNATVLWHGGKLADFTSNDRNAQGDAMGGNAPWMVYYDGLLYHRNGAHINALTGEIVKGRIARRHNHERAVPETQHMLKIAGNHVYGLTGFTMNVQALEGGRIVNNRLVRAEATEAEKKIMHYCFGDEQFRMPTADSDKGRFSYGHVFTFGGDALFVRSLTRLICLGSD